MHSWLLHFVFFFRLPKQNIFSGHGTPCAPCIRAHWPCPCPLHHPLCDLLFSVFYERLKGTHDFCDFCVARFTAAMGLVLSCNLNRFALAKAAKKGRKKQKQKTKKAGKPPAAPPMCVMWHWLPLAVLLAKGQQKAQFGPRKCWLGIASNASKIEFNLFRSQRWQHNDYDDGSGSRDFN